MNLTALDRAMASKDQSSILLLINAGNGEPHAPPTLDESGPPKHLQPLIPPRVVKDSSSVYHDAKRTGITHTVTVRVWVDDKGIPRRARAVRVSGTPVDREIMVERALDTIMFFRFSPGRDATGPVDCWTLIDVKLEPWTPVVIRE